MIFFLPILKLKNTPIEKITPHCHYIFRLASSHLKEAVDFLEDSMRHEEIINFISMFNDEDKQDFNDLLKVFDTEKEKKTYTNLNNFRNNSFHYPKLDNKDLKQVIKKVKDNELELFKIIDGSERALFSDLISTHLVFKYLGEGKNLKNSLNTLSKAASILLRLRKTVFKYFIEIKKPDFEIIYEEI